MANDNDERTEPGQVETGQAGPTQVGPTQAAPAQAGPAQAAARSVPPVETVELHQAPRPAALYRRAVLGVLPLPGQRRTARALPATRLALAGVRVDVARLAAYDRVCGFRLTDTLPPTYPHVLAFPLAMALMSGPDFPLPVVGLVHVANRIEVRRPVGADEPLDLAVYPTDLRPHHRGRQFDLVATATAGGVEVWREVSTYLRREPTGGTGAAPDGTPADAAGTGADQASHARSSRLAETGRRDGAGGPHRANGREETGGGEPVGLWRVGARVGPDYAAVSGDRNPIHTSRLGARLFGFRRPIAHGMWSKARCLAAMAGRLPDAYTVEVAFKAPIGLPATVAFSACPARSFSLSSARSGRPHLTGEITAAGA